MNREYDSRGGVMENDRRERRRLSAYGIVEAFFFVIWLLLGTSIISTMVGLLFAIRFWSAFSIVSGTLAAVLSAIRIAKSLKRKRARTATQDSLTSARHPLNPDDEPVSGPLPARTADGRNHGKPLFPPDSRRALEPVHHPRLRRSGVTPVLFVLHVALVVATLFLRRRQPDISAVLSLAAVASGVAFVFHFLFYSRVRYSNVSIGTVVGVMAMFLLLDLALTTLLQSLRVNIFLAHMLIMGSGIILAGATTVLSDRASTIAISTSGGFFTSFILTLLVIGNFQGLPGRPDAVNAAIHVMITLLVLAFLFVSSYAVVFQATKHPWTR